VGVLLGLDIGAVSIKLAALPTSDWSSNSVPTATSGPPAFFVCRPPGSSGLSERALILSVYRRIRGSPLPATLELLQEFGRMIPLETVDGVRLTGSGSPVLAKILNVAAENEFRAVAKGLRALYPKVRTVFELGGESSKYLRIDGVEGSPSLGVVDYASSGDCAAGTGSFLDQQAQRLRYSVEEVGAAACGASCAARVAGRCSVFAKTDMIHAQQKGYTTEQILRGLCEAVARNFKASIVRGRQIVPPVALLGGIALNQGVHDALREVFRLKDSEFIVPELHAWMGAIGAALFELEQPDKHPLGSSAMLQKTAASVPATFASSPALSLSNVLLLRERVKSIPRFRQDSRVEAYLGVDIGSVSTNLAVIDREGNLLKEIYLATAGRPIEVVNQGLREIESEMGHVLDIRGVGTTGSGRELIGELVGADTINDEITAHKTGAMHVCRQLGMPAVDTIFEIGGQDSKFIRIEQGIVVDFAMNEACAAGTGSFLEEQAEKLGISIKGEFAQQALASHAPTRLGERCTVFMERDVTGLLLKGARVKDLCAGLAYSVALNYLNRVVRGRKIGEVIYFQGGTAYNDAVAAAFSQILGKQIIVPPHNGVIGAIGMALIARDRMQDSSWSSRFRGYDLLKVNFTSRDFVCRACSNDCEMKEFEIEGQKSYWGDKCSDKFRKPARTSRKPVIEDLVSYRDRLLDSALETPSNGGPAVGLPRATFFYDHFPFWTTYLAWLGCRVVASPQTDGRIAAAGEELALAQPCFPVQVAHGHVRNLLDRGVDYLLVPNIVNVETPVPALSSHLCPWTQTLPFVLRAVPQWEGVADKLLTPTVHFRLGQTRVARELQAVAQQLGSGKRESDRAVAAAYEAQHAFNRRLLEAGTRALKALRATERPAIVLVGRPYNLYDRNINCDIPRKLRRFYGVNVVPLDFLPLDREDISSVNDNMYWNCGRLILAAAQVARRFQNLHLIYISNFKCGPDSYIKSFLDGAAGKPSLILQFDGHSNDAGFLTRCEAYLDSKGFL
jgi:predicted CoA-substrate-specific enzyme activase